MSKWQIHTGYWLRKDRTKSSRGKQPPKKGIVKVDTPLEITTRTLNHPCIAHPTANASNIIAAEVSNKIPSLAHCVQRQTEVLHLAGARDIIIRDGA